MTALLRGGRVWPDPVPRDATAWPLSPASPEGRRPTPGDNPAAAAAVGGVLGALLSTPLVAALAAAMAVGLPRADPRRPIARSGARTRADAWPHRGRGGARGRAAQRRSLRAAAAEPAAAACPGSEAGMRWLWAVRDPRGSGPDLADAALRCTMVAGGAELSIRTGCTLATVLGAAEDDL